MSNSKFRNLTVITIATFCLIATSLAAQAADQTEKDQPGKERLVLMPLQAGENDKRLMAQMETELIQGLGQQYEVISGKRVIKALKKASNKTKHGARNKGCDEMRCLKYVANELRAKIFAMVHETKTEEGYLLTLDIKNVMTDQAVLRIAMPCKGCDQLQAPDENGTRAPVAATHTAIPTTMPERILEPGEYFRDCVDCPDMVVIPSGSFDMGSIDSDEKDEKPDHRVILEQTFAMGRIEITKGQFAAFVSATGHDAGDQCWTLKGDQWKVSASNNWRDPGYTQDDNHPVACINWIDARAYVKWLSDQTGKHYQLPSESQWEYACRGGEQIEYCGSDNVDSVAWYDQNSGKTTHPAATKQANAFGLYDMSGNVGEWVEDSYHDRYHDGYNAAPSDGSAWAGDVSKRVLRGGSWLYSRNGERSAFRSVSSPDYRYFDTGFRVARTLP
jgi:formylglycine-generating enzyme required for sulfatase activity